MNKVTLSAVALAAIAAPVQIQAADLTKEQQAANEASYKKISQAISDAIVYVTNECKNVKDYYLTELSKIQAELNGINIKTTLIDEDKYLKNVDNLKIGATTAQQPYKLKNNLLTEVTKLKESRDAVKKKIDALTYTKKDKAAKLDKVGVDALVKRVDDFDLKDIEGCVETSKAISTDIAYANKTIKEIEDNLVKDEEAAAKEAKLQADYEAAKKAVTDAVAEARTKYNTKVNETISLLPTEPYEDWQKKALEELNAQYHILTELTAEVDVQDDKRQNVIDKKDAYLAQVDAVNAKIDEIFNDWASKKSVQESAYSTKTASAAQFQKDLNTVVGKLAANDKKELNDDITAIQNKINKLNADIEAAYKEHTIDALEVSEIEKEIDADITALRAYQGHLSTIATVQGTFDKAVKNAKKASKDKSYNAYDYLTGYEEEIQNGINALKTAAKDAYEKKSNHTVDAGAVNTKITNYNDWATLSLSSYDKAAGNIAAAKEQLNKLTALVKDEVNVTVNGTTTGKTYKTLFAELQGEIDAINKAITDAKAQTGEKHKKAMKTAADKTYTTYDEKAAVWNFTDNKKNFEDATRIEAAKQMVTTANDLVTALSERLKKANTGDNLGNQKTEIEGQISALNDKITAANEVITKAGEPTAKNAAEIIAALSTVNANLLALEKDVEKVEQAAADARVNHSLYTAVIKKIDEVTAKYTALNEKMEGEAECYRQQMSEYGTTLQKAKTNADKAYAEVKMATLSEPLNKDLDNISAELDALPATISANSTAKDKQIAACEALQKLWDTVFDKISNYDLSSKATEYLNRLAVEQQNITKLSEDIWAVWNEGNSVAKTSEFASENSEIEKAIKAIQNEQAEGYNAAIEADNVKQHELFTNGTDGTWDIAYAEFSNAIAKLNAFSSIKNDALKTAVDNLVDTHKAIYAYAEKLRNLAADESEAYGKVTSPDRYFSKNYSDKANTFKSEIAKLLLDYQTKVNAEAIKIYEETWTTADAAVYMAKDAIDAYEYPEKANAFKDIDDVLKEIQTALDKNDADFALKLDTWLETIALDALTEKLAADKEKAADAEYTYQVLKASKVYQADKAAIEALGADYKGYVDQLVARAEKTIDAAGVLYTNSGDNTFDELENILTELNKFYCTAKKDHTDIYNTAIAAATNAKANQTSYDKLIAKLDLVEADFGDLAANIEKLLVFYQKGTVYNTALAVDAMLEGMRGDVEEWYGNGLCDDNEADVNTFFDNDNLEGYVKQIADLKYMTVADEATALKAEVDKLKDLFNQAAAQDLDGVKEYEEKINALSTAIDAVPTKYNESREDIFVGCVDRYLEIEKEIAEYGKALDEIANYGAYAAAKAEVEAALPAVEALVAEAQEKAAYDEAIAALYGDDAAAVAESLEEVKATIASADEAGQLLLVKDNLINRIGIVEETVNEFLPQLSTVYNKHVTSNEVYNTLSAQIQSAESWFNEVKGNIAEYEYAADYKMYGRDANGNWVFVSVVDWYNTNIAAEIELTKNDLEAAKANFSLIYTTAEGTVNTRVANLRGTIDNYYKQVTVNEAQQGINAVDNTNYTAWNVYRSGKYTPTTAAAIQAEYSRIYAAVNAARTYNDNVSQYGSASKDVYGNDISYNGEPIHQNYISEAWPAVKAWVAEFSKDVEALKALVENNSYVLGDLNRDGKVNVTDYDEVRRIILSGEDKDTMADEAMAYAADVNEDGSINVADLSKISNYIFQGEAFETVALSRRSSYLNNSVNVGEMTTSVEGEETTLFGKTVRIALCVNSTEELTAGQMDIVLPEGMKAVGVEASARTANHNVALGQLANGVRVLISNVENIAISGAEGAVAYLDVQVESSYNGGDINVANILFTDSKARSLALTANGAGATTGIDSIQAATVKERIYSVGGQMKKAVQKGINIIVGENGSVKKVLKK